MATPKKPAYVNGPSLPAESKKKKGKDPNSDPLSSLKASTIETDMRRDINAGLFSRPTYAFHEMAAIQSMLGDKVRFWAAQIGSLDYEIEMAEDAIAEDAPADKKAKAEKQKEVLTSVYESFKNLRGTIRHLARGKFYGFAVVRKRNNRFDAIQPWNVIHDIKWQSETAPSFGWYWNPLARTYFNKDDGNVHKMGADFLVHERDDSSLLELLRLAFRATTIMDFRERNLEAASKNQVVILTGANLPDKTSIEGINLISAMTAARNGESAVMAKGDPACQTEVIKLDASKGLPFYNTTLESIDQMMTKAVTGGMLTMLSMPTGIGSGASGEHDKTLKTLIADEAAVISEFFQTQIDEPALRAANLLEKDERPLAWFRLSERQELDQQAGADLLAAVKDAGFDVDEGQASELVDLTLTRAAPMPQPEPLKNAIEVDREEAQKLGTLDQGFFDFLAELKAQYGGQGPATAEWFDAIEKAVEDAPIDAFVDSETFQAYMEKAMNAARLAGAATPPEA